MVDTRVVCLDGSLYRMDGGGRRVRAFLDALAAVGADDVDIVGVGPRGTEGLGRAVSSRVHRAKRRLLPIMLRARVDSELSAARAGGPTISLIPSAHRWALTSQPCWLDYPDLWSNIARTHASTVDRISASVSRAQARVWTHREAVESARAEVVSAASWSDCAQLGRSAKWLPTPVGSSKDLVSRRLRIPPDHQITYGMLANFDYPPNRHAYDRLATDWLRHLLPGSARVVVAGFGSDRLPRRPEIEILGEVDTPAHFYDLVDVVVAPVELGGGMKVKVVEALLHGVAVMASDHAATGLPPAMARECLRWRDASACTRDPRTNDGVLRELTNFTVESFRSTFTSLWRQRMLEPERCWHE